MTTNIEIIQSCYTSSMHLMQLLVFTVYLFHFFRNQKAIVFLSQANTKASQKTFRPTQSTWRYMYWLDSIKGSANVQHTDLKTPWFGRGGISEDLKSILITVWYSASEVFVHLPCPSSNCLQVPWIDSNHLLCAYLHKSSGLISAPCMYIFQTNFLSFIRCRSDVGLISRVMGPNYSHDL